MSIKKRLILSNIAMIVMPFISFLIIEVLLGFLIFYMFNGSSENMQLFLTVRMIGLLAIVTVVNGLLTYFVSKSILRPINGLMTAANEMSNGNLDFKIEKMSNDELGMLAEAFETMRLKLKEAQLQQQHYEDNRKELIASISHDIKTPITSIKGYVKGMMDGVANTPEKMERCMETIYNKANEMDGLIDELFLYSKLDLEQVTFKFEEVDLVAYFEDVVDDLRFSFERDGGIVEFEADSALLLKVQADREQLRRAIENIIQNSLKYIKDNKKLTIQLEEESDQVKVSIQDNGPGIPQEAIPFIFDSFYRTDASRNSSTGGSGLGLSIVKRIIEGHGGTIWADSEMGKGTTITFMLNKVGGVR